MRLSPLLFCVFAVGPFAEGSFAQGEPPDVRPVSSVRRAKLELATGEITPAGGRPSEAAEATCFANTDTSGFYSVGVPNKGDEWLDWGVVPPCSGDIVSGFVLGYASTQINVSEGGPGAELCVAFYSGATGFCADSGAQPVASFSFTGLPGIGTGVQTGFGIGWYLTVDLDGGFEFQMPAGPFGYSLKGGGDDGAGEAQTGPLLCYAGNDSGGPDGNGQVDAYDAWTPDLGGACVTRNFGGAPFDFSSFFLKLMFVDEDFCAWTEGIIDASSSSRTSVLTADFNGDGDQDVLVGGSDLDCYDNTFGDGSAWTHFPVATAGTMSSAAVGDVDGDGALDVVAAVRSSHVFWYENVLGNGSSWSSHQVTGSLADVQSVDAVDLDGDGDLDPLSASRADDTIAWYENLLGDGSTWSMRPISTALSQATTARAADVDGDGDPDVVAGGRSNTLRVYGNLVGDGSSWNVTPMGGADIVAADICDVDGDGDLDALSVSTSVLLWHENAASDGSLWVTRTVASSLPGPLSVFGADFDGDGDGDILSGVDGEFVGSPGDLVLYENSTGDGTSWIERRLTRPTATPAAVSAGDVDGDGDLDALSAYDFSVLAWYESPYAASLRNAGSNPASYFATAPRLGETFVAGVDLTTTGHPVALVLGYRAGLTFALGGGQTLLVDLSHPEGEVFGFAAEAGPAALFSLDVPSESSLCGMRVYSQAVHFGGGSSFALSNARDLIVGP